MAKRIDIDEVWLREQYITNKLSTPQIAKLFGCGATTVWWYLKRYNIPTRTQREGRAARLLDESYRKHRSERQTEINKTHPGIIDALRRCNTDTDIVSRRACTLRETLSDPVIHEARTKFLQELKDNPLVKEKHARSLKDYYKDPANYNKRVEIIRKCCQTPEAIQKRRDAISGPNHYNWRGGVSFEPYSSEFNEHLRESIRIRDNRTCAICGIKEDGLKLDVHHINYDKHDLRPLNLISLCHRCHTKTMHRRYMWHALLASHWALNPKINLNYNF